MNYFKDTVLFLENALSSSLTTTQKLIVYLHYSLSKNQIDVANFAIENRLSPCMYLAKLASFGEKLNDFWQTVAPEKINEYQNNPELLIKDLSKYEEKDLTKADLNFLEKSGFSQMDIEETLNNMSFIMAKEISNNKKIVNINLEYLIKLGVNNYREIFKKYYELFLLDPTNFENIFNKYDQSDLIIKLEKNVAIIEYL